MQIHKPKDLLGRGTMTLVYGPTGCGKTTLAGSLAAVVPTLFLSTDIQGAVTLAKHGYEPDIVEIASMDEIGKVVSEVDMSSYGGFVLDTISELQMQLSEDIIQTEIEKDRVTKDKGRRVIVHSEYGLEMQDWGQMLYRFWRMVHYFQLLSRDKGAHVVFTAQVVERPSETREKIKNEKGENILVTQLGPSLRGAWRDMIGAYFSIVGYMKPLYAGNEVIRRVYLEPMGDFYAKSRYSLEASLDNPTMAEIISAIQRSKT